MDSCRRSRAFFAYIACYESKTKCRRLVDEIGLSHNFMHDDVFMCLSTCIGLFRALKSPRGPYGILTLQVKSDGSALLRHDARLQTRRAAKLEPDPMPISRV